MKPDKGADILSLKSVSMGLQVHLGEGKLGSGFRARGADLQPWPYKTLGMRGFEVGTCTSRPPPREKGRKGPVKTAGVPDSGFRV